jgi:hypothetical protein
MKSASVLAALGATLVGIVAAHGGHSHQMLHKLMKKGDEMSPVEGSNNATCGCVTSVVTWYGEATCMYLHAPANRTRILTRIDISGPTNHHNTPNNHPHQHFLLNHHPLCRN